MIENNTATANSTTTANADNPRPLLPFAHFRKFVTAGAVCTMTHLNGEKLDPPAPRKVIKVRSADIIFGREGKPSYLQIPPASLIEWDGETLRFFEAGIRVLTDAEKAVRANAPSRRPENKELLEREMLSDGSSLFFADKSYYAGSPFPYLNGLDEARGCQLVHRNGGEWIEDNKIKGRHAITYHFELGKENA